MTDSEALYISKNYIKLLKREIEDLKKDNLIEIGLIKKFQSDIKDLQRRTSEDKIEIKKDIRVQELKKENKKLQLIISRLRKDNENLINKNIQMEKRLEEFGIFMYKSIRTLA